MINPEYGDFLKCLSTEGDLVHLTLKTRPDTLCGKPLKAVEPEARGYPCLLCRTAGRDIHTETPPPYTT
jgi:hypothetical protein